LSKTKRRICSDIALLYVIFDTFEIIFKPYLTYESKCAEHRGKQTETDQTASYIYLLTLISSQSICLAYNALSLHYYAFHYSVHKEARFSELKLNAEDKGFQSRYGTLTGQNRVILSGNCFRLAAGGKR
jgi:hypothetical protein